MSVISSLTAKCKDCHACIRACPVKAISLRNGQAQVVDDRCIVCGLCVMTCPQRAKTVQDGTSAVEKWQAEGFPMVVSLAPSFPAAFPDLEPLQVIAGLEALGFSYVEETAIAATSIARHYQAQVSGSPGKTAISSCCPVVVNLVELYFPELIAHLVPTVSPMILHGKKLKEQFGAKVVFIGPCAGKIDESLRPAAIDRIDAVLTFRQLAKLWRKRGIDPKLLSARALPTAGRSVARLYPLRHGLLAASGIEPTLTKRIAHVAGIENCKELFADLLARRLQPAFIEAFACREGCVGGPEMPCTGGVLARREAVIRYHEQTAASPAVSACSGEVSPVWAVPPAEFLARRPQFGVPSEREIRRVLEMIGMESATDERNCGGCGYPTCREKAVAALQGLAEAEMCIPFMRAKFESLSHLVVESSPNGVVVVNSDLTIHQFNAEAERMFNPTRRSTKGAHLAEFFDPLDFICAQSTGQVIYRRVEHADLGLVTRQVIYTLPEYSLVIGIVTDITDEERRHRELEAKHQVTIQRATAVISNQMKLAQQIAGLLGESTAATKATLFELINSLTDGNGDVTK